MYCRNACRVPVSAGSTGMGNVIDRLSWRSTVGGRDDEDTANGEPGENISRSVSGTIKPEVISKLNAPILNRFSTFNPLDGRMGGFRGEDGGVKTCSFFGLVVVVEGDQGAIGTGGQRAALIAASLWSRSAAPRERRRG